MTNLNDPRLVDKTALWSLYAQIILGLFSFVGFVRIDGAEDVLVALLVSDIVVQGIEFIFYLIFIRLTAKRTIYRYVDWYISTPIMLISTAILLEFFATEATEGTVTLSSFFSDYTNETIYIVSMNAIMLSCGLLAEIFAENRLFANSLITLGTLAFAASFIVLYTEFGIKTTDGLILLSIMCFIWSLYGVAALLNYVPKNVLYNILDIFAKNFYGTFIAIYLLIR